MRNSNISTPETSGEVCIILLDFVNCIFFFVRCILGIIFSNWFILLNISEPSSFGLQVSHAGGQSRKDRVKVNIIYNQLSNALHNSRACLRQNFFSKRFRFKLRKELARYPCRGDCLALIKNWFTRSVRISSYGCTREICTRKT